jgi:hypothetical protein
MQIQKNIENLLIYLNILVVQQIETSNLVEYQFRHDCGHKTHIQRL